MNVVGALVVVLGIGAYLAIPFILLFGGIAGTFFVYRLRGPLMATVFFAVMAGTLCAWITFFMSSR